MSKRILIIDDDPDMCLLLNRFLTRNGYELSQAYSGEKGIEKYKEEKFDVVICDYKLGDIEGKDVLESIKAYDPTAIVIIITGYSDIKTAVEVIKSGAYDYITKPLIPDEVLSVLKELTADPSAEDFYATTSKKSDLLVDNETFKTGPSKESKELYHLVEIVANTGYNVVVYGESGSGKEVVARAIHSMSNRKDHPFTIIDCSLLSKDLAGSELFGHNIGAFTGATDDKTGYFELAAGGTIYLDQAGQLPFEIQVSLMRALEERRFRKIGSDKDISLDVRFVVSSNENLQDTFKKGKLKEGLYHRFNEFSIVIPRLVERQDDIPFFANYFLQKTNREFNKPITGFDEEVMKIFEAYSWPGNLRELRNVVRRAALLCDSTCIDLPSLPFEIITDSSLLNKEKSSNDIIAKDEYEAILSVLEAVNFNKFKAAELLQMDSTTLYNKIRYYHENLYYSDSGKIF